VYKISLIGYKPVGLFSIQSERGLNMTTELHEFDNTTSGKLFETGKLFPPTAELHRLSKYIRGKKLVDNRHWEMFNRASALLKDTPHKERIDTLYLACGIVDILVTKPADLMYGEQPTYESGKGSKDTVQKRLNSIVEENNLNLLGHEVVVGAGYRGDSFLKTYFGYRNDYSDLPYIPAAAKMEAIIDAQDPSTVFPELAKGSRKKFKAINVAYVEWVEDLRGNDVPYLNVERHTAGFIEYFRFRLHPEAELRTDYGANINQYRIEERVATGRTGGDVIETGVDRILVSHIPYKTNDEEWQGVGTAEKIEGTIAALNDRLAQIDYVLFKHSDPTVYGKDLQGTQTMAFGGRYIPVRKDEVAPAYMTWDGKLEGAFKQLELLINLVFQIAETPQWIFGGVIGNAGGTGTSHTDNQAIVARFMPILSKVKRIRAHVDIAMRDALYNAMLLENVGNEGVEGFAAYTAEYPKIVWRDGIPRNEKEDAEIMSLRTGGRQTIDTVGAIKKYDNLNDEQAEEIVERIDKEGEKDALVAPSIFNEEDPAAKPVAADEDLEIAEPNDE
jgi:hypothetical protein